jgi:hypothetical protein
MDLLRYRQNTAIQRMGHDVIVIFVMSIWAQRLPHFPKVAK